MSQLESNHQHFPSLSDKKNAYSYDRKKCFPDHTTNSITWYQELKERIN